MNPLDHIMGTEEASELWGLTQDHIKRLCREGRVKCMQIGKTWVLDKDQTSPAQPDHPKNWRGTRGKQTTQQSRKLILGTRLPINHAHLLESEDK